MYKEQKYYNEYTLDRSLNSAFICDERIPLLSMHQLRVLDFRITRRISYERTVSDFLLALAVNDSLRPLRNQMNMVILLNDQGMLVREAGEWTLYFTPTEFERSSYPDDAPIYPIFEKVYAKLEAGELAMCKVPARSNKTLIAGVSPFSILDEYCKSQTGQYIKVAEQIVTDGTKELFDHVPVCQYNHLATVDLNEIESYNTIRRLLDDYSEQCEASGPDAVIQPLSIAVFGHPGSGKSFGVKQIALASGKFCMSAINLSQCENAASLFDSLDEALMAAGNDVPLIFFDEFDSEKDGAARGWLRYFLAPMQDGEYVLHGHTKTIRRAVFVFAGGTAPSFNEFLPGDDEEKKAEFRRIKGSDFVSRLKGILNIKGLNPDSPTDRTHIIRRAMLLRTQIERGVPNIYDPKTGKVSISPGLLATLLRVSEYRHGARSLEFILAMCRLGHATRFTPSSLPMNEQLDIHLNVEDFERKLTFEQTMGNVVEKYAKVSHETYRKRHLQEMKLALADERGYVPEEKLADVYNEEEMQDWKVLDEFFKEGYRSRIRYLGENLALYSETIGIRPIVPNSVETIRDLYGPDLEKLCDIEHQRWVKDKLEDGWTLGPKDSELKHSPELVPYAELPETTKEFVRREIREVPGLLKAVGYELYRKAYI